MAILHLQAFLCTFVIIINAAFAQNCSKISKIHNVDKSVPTSVVISYSAPTCSDKFDGFVAYACRTQKTCKSKTLAPDITSVTYGGLNANSYYQVTVTTYTIDDAGKKRFGPVQWQTIKTAKASPDSPTNLKVTIKSVTSATISWSQPINYAAQTYIVQMNGMQVAETKNRAVTVINLGGGKSYFTSVRACKAKGQCGIPVTAETVMPDGVPAAVMDLTQVSSTDTSVTFSWKPPKQHNGVILSYFIRIYDGPTLAYQKTLRANSTKTVYFRVNGLKTGVSYRASVAATNSRTTGQYSDIEISTSKPNTPIIGNMTADAVTESGLRLYWNCTADVEFYLSWCEIDDANCSDEGSSIQTSGRYVELTGLEVLTTYRIKLKISGAKQSLSIDTTTLPPPPEDITSDRTDQSSVSLLWTSSFVQSDKKIPYKQYLIRQVEPGVTEWNEETMANATFNFLDPNVDYKFELKGCVDINESPLCSRAVPVDVHATGSTNIANLTALSLDEESVNVYWNTSAQDFAVVTWCMQDDCAKSKTNLTRFVIYNLEPYTFYNVSVEVHPLNSRPVTSQSIAVRTLIPPPDNFTGGWFNGNSIKLEYRPSMNNTPKQEYNIRVVAPISLKFVNTDRKSVIYSKLSSPHNYTFELFGCTVNDSVCSRPTTLLVEATNMSTPENATVFDDNESDINIDDEYLQKNPLHDANPIDTAAIAKTLHAVYNETVLNGTAIDETSIKVWWLPLKNDQQPKKPKTRVRLLDSVAESWIYSDKQEQKFTRLTPGTEYTVEIAYCQQYSQCDPKVFAVDIRTPNATSTT